MLDGHAILVVEDEAIIAFDIASTFEAAGARVVIAGALGEARDLVEQADLSAAVIDFGLGHNDATAIVVRLKERGIPYILHSGYGNHGPACSGGIVVPKPAGAHRLLAVMVGLVHGPRRRATTADPPAAHAPILDPDRLHML